MKGYTEERGQAPLDKKHIQTWFWITSPVTAIWFFGQLKGELTSAGARVATALVAGPLALGFAYCIGSKFGHITGDFASHLVPVTGSRPRGPPLPLPRFPPLTWSPSVGSHAGSSDSRLGSSNIEMH